MSTCLGRFSSCLRIQLLENTAAWGYRQPQGTTAVSGWVNTITEGERMSSCLSKFSNCLRKSSTLWMQSKDDCLTTWKISESAWTVQRPNSWTKSRQQGVKSFPLCYSQWSLQLRFEISISSNSRNLLQILIPPYQWFKKTMRNLKSENSQDYT